jgi:phosphotriesterase-related protein
VTSSRRSFLKAIPAAAAAVALSSRRATADDGSVITVRGPIRNSEMGVTLTHEHVLASFQPFEEREKHPLPYDQNEVVEVVRPYLTRIKELGCRTFVDATAVGLGRDARLLKRLSEETGLHILTTTGNYAALDAKFLPSYVSTDSVEALGARWIAEARHGIDGTDVRPGFIKLGFNGGPLTENERKLIGAAAIAHRETGLTIGAHTGPAVSAFAQLAVLEQAKVHPSAWIWIHAQNEEDLSLHVKAARLGAWISFDGVSPTTVAAHVAKVKRLSDEGLIGRVLVSQDAGWYHVGQPRGGTIRPYDTVFTAFMPAARAAGLTDADIDTIFVKNPASAFSIAVRAGHQPAHQNSPKNAPIRWRDGGATPSARYCETS